MAVDVLTRCRDLLADVTPMETDCGLLCGAACCSSLPGEETGMLLFPGEEALAPLPAGWRILDTQAGKLLVCDSRCDRRNRPLSCRLFPLLPLIRGDAIKVAVDARARAVCPMAAAGAKGCSQRFVDAVRQCGQWLREDSEQRDFLLNLTRAHDALRDLQRAFGGG